MIIKRIQILKAVSVSKMACMPDHKPSPRGGFKLFGCRCGSALVEAIGLSGIADFGELFIQPVLYTAAIAVSTDNIAICVTESLSLRSASFLLFEPPNFYLPSARLREQPSFSLLPFPLRGRITKTFRQPRHQLYVCSFSAYCDII